ncbi:Chromosome partition protein Smc [Candidatus Nitrotoga sp. BS]|uniref:chromosome segregation protein SMC n=1 Tax=Candidatus Nitrotoga sp. BS TaxID=2890408 RepID=UPI001EF1A55D|nr:chromosome segregation protein SMC [Candidatus Nitrotoga sp. BS]CAH1201433.1 Chromosome partition protein Smc [Candidatus Nitrotoga sp. BS]
MKLRLSHVKIAGFKSFVDPTHIALPGQIVGIVGPNGCGKSNVIDALRWVLGESRASALRGESMQDVIFNGSGKRKPVSRASVELIFDNSLGKAGGQWSSYAEISIKRVLLRDGNSSYHINNQHVRRKDITDIFLGTGLGARAYAIIEQGMISRIIEAKPEELRIFLEEAAGVSKYRDRRRETELRISDTHDNLLRVDDILLELTKQLTRLTAQAAVAKRYCELESKRDTTQQLLWLVNKQEAETRRVRFAQGAEKTKNELEAETARLREMESQLEHTRSEHYTQADALHAEQGELYAANAEIARLEQQIAHLNDQRMRLTKQLADNELQLEQQRVQLQGVESLLTHWQQQQKEADIRVKDSENRANAEALHLPQAEEAVRIEMERHNTMQREQLIAQQQLQQANSELEHIQRNVQQLEVRRSRLLLEQDNLPQIDSEALTQMQCQFAETEIERDAQQQELTELQAQLPEADTARRNQRIAMQELERQLSQVEARLSALQQLQKQVDNDKNLKQWLSKHQLDQLPRLWQSIGIEAGWEDALEAVLRERLNALALPHLDNAEHWSDAPPARLAVFSVGGALNSKAQQDNGLTPLGQFVSYQNPQVATVVMDWLSDVYVTDTLAQGLKLRERLPGGAWLVTPQGHLIGAHSVLFHAPDNQVHGLLARQREIERLTETAQQQAKSLDDGKSQAALAEETYHAIESRISRLRAADSALQQRLHEVQVQILKLTQANERSHERATQITHELQELAEQSAGEQCQHQEIAERMVILRESIATQQVETDQMKLQVVAQESILRKQRECSQKAQNELQEARFFVKSCTEKIADLNHNFKQIGLTLAQLEHTLIQNHAELDHIEDGNSKQQLQEALSNRQTREQALTEARNTLEQTTNNLNKLEQERLSCEQKLHPLREKLSDLLLKEQEARLQCEQWAEQLQDADETTLLALLESGNIKLNALQNELNRLNNDITELGLVNLAALEELNVAQERKTYLDAQAKDLTEAMDTLRGAIRRIDKESRELLMTTYNEVNRHMAEMFPVLFGGGEARLVLTGDEILDSGIQVMAQPPGKKNASIHLLSGGEKALTAIALIFSMFQLNPAPFCLLDEVDAPLDDTNTERLCKLIQKMAQHTQFIFISHNKITMELAQQLVGVTMQERGVSHVVTVDIEEALRLRDDG